MTISSQPTLSRMRPAILGALALVLVALAGPAPAGAGTEALSDLEGRRLEAGALGKGAVIAVFMATWSPRCRDVVERTNAIEGRWGDRARVVLIDFQEDPETVREFLAGAKTVPVYLDRDGVFSKEHAITFLPGLLVLQDGSVAFRGRLGDDPDGILKQILD